MTKERFTMCPMHIDIPINFFLSTSHTVCTDFAIFFIISPFYVEHMNRELSWRRNSEDTLDLFFSSSRSTSASSLISCSRCQRRSLVELTWRNESSCLQGLSLTWRPDNSDRTEEAVILTLKDSDAFEYILHLSTCRRWVLFCEVKVCVLYTVGKTHLRYII